MSISQYPLRQLAKKLKGELHIDQSTRLQYATDASVYREVPMAVALPKDKEDLRTLILFATEHNISLIPRAAGTSLAGQVVGSGIVVDVSKHMNRILEVNKQERWVRVEPGVILDELNGFLKTHGLFFGPETSTSNRCMMGGMVGNNACGAHSLVYGSTRDHLISITSMLSDGTEVEFATLSNEDLANKCQGNTLESKIYRHIHELLSDQANQEEIRREFPDPRITRRNTGYAIDLLLACEPFSPNGQNFNFCRLLAGSEGTLCFFTEIKLNLVEVPGKEQALVCVHLETLEDAFLANLIALKYHPAAVELMDHVILEQTENNIEQQKNRFFIQGKPAAILIIEFISHTQEDLISRIGSMEREMRLQAFGYHFPVVKGSDINKVWALRKAGLGVLSNMAGDAKPVTVIEDTAVAPTDLPEYMRDLRALLARFDLQCVYHAHIGSGELHLRPVLNLKDSTHVLLFQELAIETAKLVKKYRGSLSGEHGDGRLRGQFIPFMLGKHNYDLLRSIKQNWDPNNIFNPGKIIDTPPMNASLRFVAGSETREIDTIFDFNDTQGLIRAIERCNGSGDCRKTELAGGAMCPSYQAERNEQDTPRARANILREFLTNSSKNNPFNHREIFDIMERCLSCKTCKAECPSNVDITKYKAEFLQHYYEANPMPVQTKVIAHISSINKAMMLTPWLYNAFISNKLVSNLIKSALGFAKQRSLPALGNLTFRSWITKYKQKINHPIGNVILFIDEFTNFNDFEIGKASVLLLNRLGYRVQLANHKESGRTYLSKGLLRSAKICAIHNVSVLYPIVTPKTPLIGLEPSAILTFRDEYPDLLRGDLKGRALNLSKHTFMIDEFIVREAEMGKINRDVFTTNPKTIYLHGHCHQKVLASTDATKKMLSLPANYHVEEIKSGCCGMAGSFGYEKKHYDFSMKIGNLILFPAIKQTSGSDIIAAPGISCRQQIKDGTGRIALHPIEILHQALADRI